MIFRVILGLFLYASAVPPHAANSPPVNSFLADSSYSLAHGNPAQQDAVLQAGPAGPSRKLRTEEIQYQHVGPAHFGAVTSGVYADGKRVFWSNGIDRIAWVAGGHTRTTHCNITSGRGTSSVAAAINGPSQGDGGGGCGGGGGYRQTSNDVARRARKHARARAHTHTHMHARTGAASCHTEN